MNSTIIKFFHVVNSLVNMTIPFLQCGSQLNIVTALMQFMNYPSVCLIVRYLSTVAILGYYQGSIIIVPVDYCYYKAMK